MTEMSRRTITAPRLGRGSSRRPPPQGTTSLRHRTRTSVDLSTESGQLQYAAGDPPLILTHVPLLQVPHDAINVHGHVHEQESPTPNRHINVSVEQLNYRPTRLSEIRRLARRLVEGRTVPGHSTRARLNVVERVMP